MKKEIKPENPLLGETNGYPGDAVQYTRDNKVFPPNSRFRSVGSLDLSQPLYRDKLGAVIL